ncbi:MAG: hypothetical protein ACM3WU_04400 [Bacillota bacterium]
MAILLAFIGAGVWILIVGYRCYQSIADTIAWNIRLDLLSSVLIGSGVTIPTVVVIFIKWATSGGRYHWIITGPYPFDSLGSGPFVVWSVLLSGMLGCILISLGLIIKSHILNPTSRDDHIHS